VARWFPRRRLTEPPDGGAEPVPGGRSFWLGVFAAVIAAAGTYAGIAAQATGPLTVMQAVWTSLAVVSAAIFAFLATQAGGYALGSRSVAQRALPAEGMAAPLWGGVPPRNPTFTNRNEAMDLIRTVLAGSTPEDRGGLRSCALQGLGGVGKTSLAAEYAHRFRKSYRLIWWVRAEHAASIADDLVRLLVALTGETNFGQADAFPRLWNELAGREPWLIVYDNAKTPTVLRELWPSGGTGDVIVTSRTDIWAEFVDDAITVEVFSRDDAVTLLRARTHDDDEPSAAEVADRLGRLPLALVQAAAYVTQTRTTFEHYAQLITQQMGDVLATTPPSDYNVPVAITWSMSIAEASAQARGARELLIFWSFLAPEQIPRDMASSCAPNLPDPLPEIAANRVRYDLAVAALTHYSLLSAGPSYLLVHRLVQLTVRLSLPEAEQRVWATISVRALSHLFPRNPRDRETWGVCAQLTPHVLVASAHATQLGSDEPIGDLLMRAGIYNMARDFLHPAADLLRMAVLDYERTEGADSLEVAVACSELAHVLHCQAKLVEELAVSEREIRIRERLNGTEDPGLVEPLRRLGNAFLELSRLDEATDSYQRALSIVESTCGDDVREALPILSALAWLNYRKGNYRTALRLCQRQLRIDISAGSPDLHTTAFIHHGLGTLRLIQDSAIDLARPIRSCNDQSSIKIAE
jgi:Tetratricopeptide repeat/NB-ARC domain